MNDDILADVLAEVARVDATRGLDLDTHGGTGGARWQSMAYLARADYDFAEQAGVPTFALALREETYEALAETDPAKLDAELVQVASLAMRWLRALRARHSRAVEHADDCALSPWSPCDCRGSHG